MEPHFTKGEWLLGMIGGHVAGKHTVSWSLNSGMSNSDPYSIEFGPALEDKHWSRSPKGRQVNKQSDYKNKFRTEETVKWVRWWTGNDRSL